MVNWQHAIKQEWATLRFGEVKVVSDTSKHLFEIEIYFGNLDPNYVKVELYTDALTGVEPERREMRRDPQLADSNNFIYKGEVPATRPSTDDTVRIIPQHEGMTIPLESNQILWQR